jgi:hypothetical protein
MFSRRAVEVLACGTPVISNYAKGLDQVVGNGNGILLVNSTFQAEKQVRRLMTNARAATTLGYRGHLKVYRTGLLRQHMLPVFNSLMARGFQLPLSAAVLAKSLEVTVISVGEGSRAPLEALSGCVVHTVHVASDHSFCDLVPRLSGDVVFITRAHDKYAEEYFEGALNALRYADAWGIVQTEWKSSDGGRDTIVGTHGHRYISSSVEDEGIAPGKLVTARFYRADAYVQALCVSLLLPCNAFRANRFWMLTQVPSPGL